MPQIVVSEAQGSDRFNAVIMIVDGRPIRLRSSTATLLGWSLIRRSEAIAGTPIDYMPKLRQPEYFEGEEDAGALVDDGGGTEVKASSGREVDDARSGAGIEPQQAGD